jgi:hypothetical protein
MAKSTKAKGSSTKAISVVPASKSKAASKDQRKYMPPFMGSISSALKASQESEHSK